MPSSGSTAVTAAKRGTSSRVSLPVPAARSSTCAPGERPSRDDGDVERLGVPAGPPALVGLGGRAERRRRVRGREETPVTMWHVCGKARLVTGPARPGSKAPPRSTASPVRRRRRAHGAAAQLLGLQRSAGNAAGRRARAAQGGARCRGRRHQGGVRGRQGGAAGAGHEGAAAGRPAASTTPTCATLRADGARRRHDQRRRADVPGRAARHGQRRARSSAATPWPPARSSRSPARRSRRTWRTPATSTRRSRTPRSPARAAADAALPGRRS